MTYYYIKGKDPSNVQLLCTQDNSTVELNKKTWNQTLSGVVHNNPLVIDTIASVGSLEFVCNIDDATISTIELIIHGLLSNYLSQTLILFKYQYIYYSTIGYNELHWI